MVDRLSTSEAHFIGPSCLLVIPRVLKSPIDHVSLAETPIHKILYALTLVSCIMIGFRDANSTKTGVRTHSTEMSSFLSEC